MQLVTLLNWEEVVSRNPTQPNRKKTSTTQRQDWGAFGSDSTTLVSASVDQIVRLWDIRTGKCLKSWQERNHVVRSIACRLDEDKLVIGTDDHKVILLDIHTGEHIKTFEGHTNRVWSVAFSPEGNMLASGSADHTVKLWDVHTGRCLNTLKEEGYRVRSPTTTTAYSTITGGNIS